MTSHPHLLLLTVVCFQNILSVTIVSLHCINNGRTYMIVMCKFIIYITVDTALPL